MTSYNCPVRAFIKKHLTEVGGSVYVKLRPFKMQDDENVKRKKSIERAVVLNDKVLICES